MSMTLSVSIGISKLAATPKFDQAVVGGVKYPLESAPAATLDICVAAPN
jgi:hypothetical protein